MKNVVEKCCDFFGRAQERLLSFPGLLIVLFCIACGFSLNYTINHLGFNTDTTEILSTDLPFQQNRIRFLKSFPQDDLAILIVVDAEAPEQTTQVISWLGKQLKQEAEYVESIYIPGEGEFFERHGLMYLDLVDLQKLSVNLTEAQPFIGRQFQQNSLSSLLSTISLAITTGEHELPIDLDPLLNNILRAIQAVSRGEDFHLSWQKLMFENEQEVMGTLRFILVKPKLDFNELIPADISLQAIRTITDQAGEIFPRSRIRITGEVALEHDELNNVARSTLLALSVSFLLVCASLLVGLGSFAMMFATLVTLIMGLILTGGFAAIAVGHLNLISIAFSVLYIGLGVDYAIHLCLRYRELLQQNIPRNRALLQSSRSVGSSIALCAITTSAGFYAFVPTAYAGVSELGIIAGTGMFIALLLTLIVLPAMLKILPLKAVSPKTDRMHFPEWFYGFPLIYRRAVILLSILFTIVALGFLTQVTFDFNPVNLRNPESESVSTFKDLLKNRTTSPLTLTVLADDHEDALTRAELLESLDTVENAITILDFIPDEQHEKLAIIEDLALVLGIQSGAFPGLHQNPVEKNIEALKELRTAIFNDLESGKNTPPSETLLQLGKELQQFLIALDAAPGPVQKEMLDKLQNSLLVFLPDTMNSLLKSLDANVVGIDDLPDNLKERWVSREGVYRVMIFPHEDLNEIENLREFVSEVQGLEPEATDLPVIYLESGNEVVKAFQQALAGALTIIVVVLLLVQRSMKDTFLILLPLVMAAIFTGATTVLFNNPFNFANIIAVPLIFGLGVDSGIHMIRRLRKTKGHEHMLLQTSTARAVFFSGLTTLVSFVSLAFTLHLGMASMGQLLAIGISLIVFCTLVVLPAFAVNSKFRFLSMKKRG